MISLDTTAIHRARTEWFETGTVSERLVGSVRPEILASWRRSKAFGAQSHVATLPYHEDNGATERLMVAAEPVLRSLAQSLSGLHAGVLLADREANIVQRWVADQWILSALDRISSDAGFGAPEHCVGTNGIGTIAELGKAQMIVGPEHFADALVNFACVGAPIHNPTTRRLEGIITLSCRADSANELLTPLMTSTAADIEHRLLESATLDERRMLDAYLAAKRRYHLVAVVGKDLLIAGARATRVLDQVVDRDVLWEMVSDAVSRAGSGRRVMPTTDGGEVSLAFTAITDGDRLIGAVVDLDEATSPPTARPKRATQTASTIQLPGDNAKWRTVLDCASRYARDRVPVVLIGDAGVGKWTLATEMLRSVAVAGTTRTVDCRDLSLPDELDGNVEAIVLRHVEALSETDARLVAAWLDSLVATRVPWLLATLDSDDESITAPHRWLADRFHAVALRVPSLQEHPDDIPAIVRSLVLTHARGREVRLNAEVVRELSRASWPGNIRELEDVVRSMIASRVGEITVADLPVEVKTRTVRKSLSPIDQMECDAIIAALHAADGNKVVAARMIGLSRSTIYRKIRAYGLDRDVTFF